LEHLARGYDSLIEKLERLGADIHQLTPVDAAVTRAGGLRPRPESRPAARPIRRVCVIGSPGSGKTYFSRELATRISFPLHHLDDHYWRAGWRRPPEPQWAVEVERLVSDQTWIIDGNYLSTLETRLRACDAIVVFDRSTLSCLVAVLRRTLGIMRGSRENLPRAIRDHPGTPLTEGLRGFLWQVLRFRQGVLRDVKRLVAAAGVQRPVIFIRSRSDSAAALDTIETLVESAATQYARKASRQRSIPGVERSR
jgi:hypothetical protein